MSYSLVLYNTYSMYIIGTYVYWFMYVSTGLCTFMYKHGNTNSLWPIHNSVWPIHNVHNVHNLQMCVSGIMLFPDSCSTQAVGEGRICAGYIMYWICMYYVSSIYTGWAHDGHIMFNVMKNARCFCCLIHSSFIYYYITWKYYCLKVHT
jgi:hypothetical protein